MKIADVQNTNRAGATWQNSDTFETNFEEVALDADTPNGANHADCNQQVEPEHAAHDEPPLRAGRNNQQNRTANIGGAANLRHRADYSTGRDGWVMLQVLGL